MKNQNGFIHIVVTITICLVAVLMVGAAWYYQQHKSNDELQDRTPIITGTKTCTVDTDCQYQSEENCWSEVIVGSCGFGGHCSGLLPNDCKCQAGKCVLTTHSNANSANINVDNSSVDTSDWQTYTNEELGISFEYPTTWGRVQEEEIDNTEKEDDVYAGKAVSISFQNSHSGYVLLASSGFRNFITDHYNGGYDLQKQCSSPGQITNQTYCTLATVAGQKTLDRIYFDAYECSPHFVREVWLNLNHQTYKGIRISIALWTDGDWDCTSDDQELWDRITDTELRKVIDRNGITDEEKNLLEGMDRLISTFSISE
ncbi:MAG: hypothetical protein PHY34_01900 [Patescibacteria group bacterium]|nr:hypothetical protein [Patescibacteria group bacterium]MDD5715312.1 hypothetical protein [Patescibacteria group bacterium]